MTVVRLLAALQPSILSRKSEEMDSSEHDLANSVVGFLIRYQDDFIVGMDSAICILSGLSADTRQSVRIEPASSSIH